VALYEKHLSFGVLVIRHTYYAAPSASLNEGIQDAAHQAIMALCEEIRQECRDKKVRRITEKYTQKHEDLQAWGRSQEMKILELRDQNDTQEAIIKELWEQLEKTSKEISEQEPMMEVKEDPQELPQVSPALPVLPQLNFYEQLMQDITENSLARVESHGSSLSTQE
jgi:predicted RNase H-like nuclease (RuvC/YqgF family)